MLPARMRSESGWSDACILNVSSRGLLIYSAGRATPGSFVEIRRGSQLVVARVVWRENQRLGLSSQDPVRVEDIISSETAAVAVQSSGFTVERRKVPRTSEQSRLLSRAMEYVFTIMLVVALAGSAAFYAHEALTTPLAAVRTALGS